MTLTMHENFSKKNEAKNKTIKQDAIKHLSYIRQKPLPYGAGINQWIVEHQLSKN